MRDVEVRRSPIEGLGLFAARPFCTGQRIRQINVADPAVGIITVISSLTVSYRTPRYCSGRRDYLRLQRVLMGPPDRHVNHSCDPNAYVFYQPDRSLTSPEAGRGPATVALRVAEVP